MKVNANVREGQSGVKSGGGRGEGGGWEERGRKVGNRKEGRRRQVRHKKSLRGRPWGRERPRSGKRARGVEGSGGGEEVRKESWDVGCRKRQDMGRLKGGRAGV